MAAMPLDEMPHHRQADTSKARTLRRKERIEGLASGLCRHADAAIPDEQFHQRGTASMDQGRLDHDQPAIRHGVARVEEEIEDCVLQGETIANYRREVRVGMNPEAQFRLP
jgi:hypothetical protein